MKAKGQEKSARGQQIKKDYSAAAGQISAEELALLAQLGSQESFEEIVCRYTDRLFTFLHHKTGNVSDAEDLVQETFIKAYTNIDKYKGRFRFSTWLFTIASRLAVSHYRKSRLQFEHQGNSGDAKNPLENVIEDETSRDLWLLVKELPVNQYQVLWLKYIEEMSVKEIAGVMRKSQINIRVLLYRARENLGVLLARDFAGDLLCSGQCAKTGKMEV